jgi:hypothetical protein
MGAKKNTLFLVLMFYATALCHAQFQIGMRPGFSVGKAQLASNVPEYEKGLNKLVANWSNGLAAEYGFCKTLAVELECLYASKNTRMRWDYTRDVSGTFSVRMRCIEVPVLLKLYLLNRSNKVFLDAGASAGFTVSIREVDEFRHLERDNENSEKVSIGQPPAENPDYSLNAGLGYFGSRGWVVWGAGLRYIHSLSNGVYALYTEEQSGKKTRYQGKDRQVRIYFTVAYVFKSHK